MKFFIRRLIAGLIATPVVAGVYLFEYLSLTLLGAEPTATITETFFIGINMGIVASLILVFYPQFTRLIDKLIQ